MYQKKTEPQYVCTRISLNQKQTSYRLVVAESYIMNIVFWYAVNRVFYGFDAIRFCSSMSICNYIVFFVAIKNIFVLIKIVYCYRFYSISVQIYITHAMHSYCCFIASFAFVLQRLRAKPIPLRLSVTKGSPCGRAPAIAGERGIVAIFHPLRRLRRHLSQRERLFH